MSNKATKEESSNKKQNKYKTTQTLKMVKK